MSIFSIKSKEISFVLRILIGCIIVWFSLDYFHDGKKIWALISVIVVSDPDFKTLRDNARSRLVNTIVGCAIGLLFIYIFGISFISVMAGVALSVLISTTFKNYQPSWKLAPVTVIILMMPPMQNETLQDGMSLALNRAGEVLYGSFIAYLLGLLYLLLEKRTFFRKDPGTGPENDAPFV